LVDLVTQAREASRAFESGDSKYTKRFEAIEAEINKDEQLASAIEGKHPNGTGHADTRQKAE
jgi:hypothetical protein